MASMTTRDDALQFGAVDWQRLIREGAVVDAAVAGGVDDGAARRYCVTKAEDVLVAAAAPSATSTSSALVFSDGLRGLVGGLKPTFRTSSAATASSFSSCSFRQRA